MTVTGLDVIELSSDFEASSTHIELRPWQWHFLHAIDGRMEVRNVAAACGVELAAAIAFVEEVHASGLLRVVAISLAEYRSTNGTAPATLAAVEVVHEPVTADDHFSSTDVLPAYEHPIPAWMMEPQPPIAYEHEPAIEHEEESPVAQEPLAREAHAVAADHVVAESHFVPEDAEAHEGLGVHDHVATHEDVVSHDYAAADDDARTEEFVAVREHAPVDEAEYEPVVSSGHAEFADLLADPVVHEDGVANEASPDHAALAFMHEDATATRAVDDLVAQHHETSYSEHEYFTSSTAPQVEDPAEHVHDYTDNYAEPVAEAEPETEVAHGNGRSAAWEPLSLVAHVDEESTPLESDSFRDPSMPEGVSIWLSHGSSSGVYEPESEEKGSVSFSLSPDDGPDTHPIAANAAIVSPREYVEPAAPPAPISDPSYQAPSQDVAGVYGAAKEPTNGHIDNLPAAQPGTGTSTADIVGSLISRALTFRIK
jgi:hypothetical protein